MIKKLLYNMKELKHIIIPDDVYYLVLSHIDTSNTNERVLEMTKERFLEVYDEAVSKLRSEIMSDDEYYELLKD